MEENLSEGTDQTHKITSVKIRWWPALGSKQAFRKVPVGTKFLCGAYVLLWMGLYSVACRPER